uniref:HTH CENPB-type domain-containing protein n=1 Tax=Eptatretus burgeri TaxID=7764 RepID=A0A8C4QHC6_EPTBU
MVSRRGDRGGPGLVPAWMEIQGLSEESLRAAVTGLGIEILGALCARAEPPTVRVRLCSLSARRFTYTMYVELCRYMESCRAGRGSERTVVPGRGKTAEGGPGGVVRIKVKEEEGSLGPPEGRDPEHEMCDDHRKFPCSSCSRSFTLEAALKMHMKKHRPDYREKEPKRTELKASAGHESNGKRQKKVMYLSQKVELLDRLAGGETAASVGRHYGVNESTVRSIKKNEVGIRASVAASIPKSAKVLFITRDPNLEKMEKTLNLWIEDQTQKQVPLNGSIIREEAKRLYDDLMKASGGEGSSCSSFLASKGWFENFKKRYGLHNMKFVVESASTDHEAAQNFLSQLKKIIEEKGYRPEQVFNADETGLFWKRMPSRKFLSKEERLPPGFKAARDRLTLLLCANASGDFMVKPMLLYRALNPRVLKGKNKNDLPVFWPSNRGACVTATVFMDWFLNCFVHEVQKYLASKSLAFKVLLILDNAPSHPENIHFAHPNVEVLFLPPNTTTLLQPLNQGVIAAFKTYYTRRTFRHIL